MSGQHEKPTVKTGGKPLSGKPAGSHAKPGKPDSKGK